MRRSPQLVMATLNRRFKHSTPLFRKTHPHVVSLTRLILSTVSIVIFPQKKACLLFTRRVTTSGILNGLPSHFPVPSLSSWSTCVHRSVLRFVRWIFGENKSVTIISHIHTICRLELWLDFIKYNIATRRLISTL